MSDKLFPHSIKALVVGMFFCSTLLNVSQASAFQNGTPKPPSIVSVQSVKKSGGVFDLKVVLSVFPGNSELPTTSTIVKAGGKSCKAIGLKTTCTIKNLKAKLKVSISATSQNKNGSSPRSAVVSYMMGSAKKTIIGETTIAPAVNQPTTTVASTSTSPPSGGSYVIGYGLRP